MATRSDRSRIKRGIVRQGEDGCCIGDAGFGGDIDIFSPLAQCLLLCDVGKLDGVADGGAETAILDTA